VKNLTNKFNLFSKDKDPTNSCGKSFNNKLICLLKNKNYINNGEQNFQ